MRKYEINKTEITENSIVVTMTSAEIHLIREAVRNFEIGSIDLDEMKLCKNIRSSISRILLDPYQDITP